ncbi:tol-pal system-associated acyl-CoA thioesterase [Futiania mangrovi]|uniref:Tol-pal system-associated acyl-CoA thioesterase n=1 Tax=Futiania mangrovi TaxID=2959716 RepID=A0A9J6PFK4_9PROT|nr:tol-pal system-associated acyl-CoA thioesterase [Futiania mangrovii]MCP1334890.1 tol-pal system-associated acyl-CoA thioesterase [Futiania mangrovii]
MGGRHPETGVFEGSVHRLPVRVYYEDTDTAGIVYYANWLRFLERGRTEYIRALGVRQSDLLTGDDWRAFAVRRVEVDYLVPARLDDALVVETWVEEARGASLVMGQQVTRDGRTLIGARVRVACIDAAGKPRRIDPEVRAALVAQGGSAPGPGE